MKSSIPKGSERELILALYWEVRKRVINNIVTYSLHFIGSQSKEIFSTTLRIKIGGLASQHISNSTVGLL